MAVKSELSFILHDNAIDVVLGLDLVLRYPGLIAIQKRPQPNPIARLAVNLELLYKNRGNV